MDFACMIVAGCFYATMFVVDMFDKDDVVEKEHEHCDIDID